MQAAVVPVLVPVRTPVGTSVSFRSFVRPPPFPLRIIRVGRRNVRFLLVYVIHRNLCGCRSLYDGCCLKEVNVGRRVGAPRYIVGYRRVSDSRGSRGVAAHLWGVHRRTPLVLSRTIIVFPSSALVTAPSLGFP